MKLRKILVIFLILLTIGCTTPKTTEIITPTPSSTPESAPTLHAIITSDLHFTIDTNVIDTLVPLVSCVEDVTQTIVNQVIDQHPDVFIMTGDNTNSGDLRDVTALLPYLKQIRDAGIKVILTTGNHDFNHMTPAQYETLYEPFLDIDNKDSNSQSYVTIINDIAIFAMDDNTNTDGIGGNFSTETLAWLKDNLQQQTSQNHFCIFLSHHNVLPLSGISLTNHYNIQNIELLKLLEQYDVRLCFSGHQHNQELHRKDNLYELLSGMPLSGEHLLGYLTIENHTVTYETKPIDFTTYHSSEFASIVKQKDEAQRQALHDVFYQEAKRFHTNEEDIEGMIQLLLNIFDYAQSGTISTHVETIKKDPYFPLLQQLVKDSNYEPWIEELLNNPPLDAHQFQFNY